MTCSNPDSEGVTDSKQPSLQSDEPVPSAKWRVLVVDDDPSIRMLLEFFFEQLDCSVVTAENGEAALEQFRASSFNIILLDLQMPGMSGLEVADAIRQENQGIPIVLITGVAHRLEGTDLEQAGITKLFTKPFDLVEMTDWFESLPR